MIRRLTPTPADSSYSRISDQKQRTEMLEHVLATSIRRAAETDEQMAARVEATVDSMSRSWRTFTDLEIRARQRRPVAEYDAAAAAYNERS